MDFKDSINSSHSKHDGKTYDLGSSNRPDYTVFMPIIANLLPVALVSSGFFFFFASCRVCFSPCPVEQVTSNDHRGLRWKKIASSEHSSKSPMIAET